MDYKTVKMPFGKYKGRFIWEIADLQYFHWLYKNTKLNSDLFQAIKIKLHV